MESGTKSFYAIFAAEVLAIAGFNTSIPIIPFYIQDLGVHDPAEVNFWVGACSTVVAVTLAVFAPIWGRLADHYGKRMMLLRAMLGGGAVMAVMGVINHPWQLVVLRGVQGALTGTVAAATVLVAAITPAARMGYTLGLLQTAVFIGSSIGPALGGVVSDLLGHRANFFFTSGLLFSAAVIIMKFVPKDVRGPALGGSFWTRVVPDFSILARSRILATILLISGLVQVATTVTSPILPLFIQSITPGGALVASTTGLIFGLYALSAALAAASLGRVGGRLGYERTLVICLAGAFLLFLPQAFVRTPLQLLVLRVLGGAFIGGTMPAINALIALRSERSRQGTVYGLSTSVANVGAATGPMIGATISSGFGYSFAFLTTAAILLGTAVFSRRLLGVHTSTAEGPAGRVALEKKD